MSFLGWWFTNLKWNGISQRGQRRWHAQATGLHLLKGKAGSRGQDILVQAEVCKVVLQQKLVHRSHLVSCEMLLSCWASVHSQIQQLLRSECM